MGKKFTPAFLYSTLLRRFVFGIFPALFLVAGISAKVSAQYCTPVSNCTNEGITNVALGSLNNASAFCAVTSGYVDYTAAAGVATPTLTAGSTYTINVSARVNSNPATGGMWIDYNQNSTFDASEFVYFTPVTTFTSPFIHTYTQSFTVPATALTGTTRMRVRSSNSTAQINNSGTQACSAGLFGETEDYSVTIAGANPCTSTPVASITSSATTVCPNTAITLTASPAGQSGLTYQFEVSTNGGTSWSNLGTSSTSPTYSIPSQTIASQYRVTVTCAGNGSNTSAPVSVAQNALTACYCTPSTLTSSFYITNFSTTGGILNISNLNSGLSPNGYGQFLSQTVSENPGQSVSFSTSFSTGTYGFSIWVDWDQNSVFDASERVFANTTGSYQSTFAGSFTVPFSAAIGTTRMRIVGDYWDTDPDNPCVSTTTQNFAEFEDYTFNVIALTACSTTPSAVLTSSATNACANVPFNLVATPNGQGGLTYVFEANTGTGWNAIASSTSPSYTVTSQTITTQYRVTVTCAGNGSNTSAPVTVTQNPVTACYCTPSSTTTIRYIDGFSTTGGASNISNLNSGLSLGGYGQFLTQDVSQVPGQSVNYSVTFAAGTYGFSIWVDWNQNGSFADAGEQVYANTTGNYLNSPFSGSFTVPLTAATGPTRMRIAADYFNTAPNDPCETGSTSEEFEDYTFITLPPCSGPPVTGSIASSPAVPCLGDSITLSIPNGTYASNLGFRWEYKDATSIWLPGSGAPGASTDTMRNFGARPTGPTWYRVTVKCRTTGDSVTSDSILISPLSITMPYFENFESIGANNELPPCMKATDIGGTNLTYIAEQGIGRRNHTPGGSKYGSFALNSPTNEQFFFTPGLPLRAGVTYAIKYWYVGGGTTGIVTTRTAIGTAADATAMTNQLGAISGATDTNYRQAAYYYTPATTGVYFVGIGNSSFNPVSGYLSIDDIQVDSLPPCSGVPNAGIITALTTSFCPGSQIDLELTNYTLASNISFEWRLSNTVFNGTAPGGTNSPFYTTGPLTTSIDTYRVVLTCNDAIAGPLYDTSVAYVITPYKAIIPYQETFEGILAANDLPTCFTTTDLNSGTFTLTSPASSNHTPGGSKYAAFGVAPSVDEWMFTPMMTLERGLTYQFSFWYRTSTSTPFPILQATVGSGPSPAQVLPVGGLLASKANAGTTTYQQFVCLYTAAATGDYSFGINTSTNGLATTARLLIDDIQVDSLPKCTDTPNIAVSPAGPFYLCPTDTFAVSAPLATNSGFDYQWEWDTDSTFPNPTSPSGITNTINYSATAPTISPYYYRLRTICTFTNDTGYSNVITVNTNVTQYKRLPYATDLETWVNNCGTKDVPADSNWLQITKTGNSSWRRDDQGSTAAWTAPTAGAYSPPARSGLHSARFHSSRAATAAGPNDPEEGTLDMYVNCNTGPGTSANKALYFYHTSPGTPTNALDVRISKDGGGTWGTLASYDSADDWRLRRIPFASPSGATIIRFAGRRTATGTGGSDIGVDSIFVAPPCNAQPVAGTIGAVSPMSICPGDTAILNLTGTSMAGDLRIEWETSTTSATGPFTSQTPAGTGGYSWSSGQLMQTTWVRAKVTCGGTGDVDSTNVIAFTLAVTPGITYAPLPVTENFESWTDRCGLKEIPSANWSNVPSFGNRSWRRNDQGASASWTNQTAGQWWPATPTAAVDSYAARFHNSAAAPDGSLGSLNLYVNCSPATPTAKELRFFVNMSDRTAGNTDTLRVLYSIDGGFTFTKLDTIRSTNGWEQKVYALPSDSPKTIIRFEAYSQTGQEDIGLDYVQVLNPCSGTPVAGTVNPVPDVCPGRTFHLSATGTSAQGGITYYWESSTTSATTGFAPVGGRQQSVLDTSITQNTWFRLVVGCGTSTVLDTSAAILVQLADTFHCYCITNAQYPYVTSQFKENIGRVTLKNTAGITMMTNGVATPINNNLTAVNAYSNFQNLPATPLYRDSTYNLEIQQISYTTNTNAKVVGWIDFNRDGIFDTATERIVNLTTTAASAPIYKIAGNFIIPSNATPGITGMRITLQEPDNGLLPDPCGTYDGYGETEDYLVELRLTPCSGYPTLFGGTASISDTSICPGYPVTLRSMGYQQGVSGVTRQWQQTTNNGVSWQYVGPQNRDSIDVIVQANTRYRFVLLCDNGVESYSNVVSTFLRPSTECYCPSYADGGPNHPVTNIDSSDIGAFAIGNDTIQVGGPHLINPMATRKWTNNAGRIPTIELWADSTYDVDIYHIMRGTIHKDAKVTVFIDYNHNLQFDVNPPAGYPTERVLTAFTNASNYYLNNLRLTIPAAQILTSDVTMMRIVLNENTGVNPASDNGCGPYTSGETEDYFVKFRCPTCPTGVVNANGSNVSNFNLFPNPTTGIATLQLTTLNAVKDIEMTVTNMTGQVIQQRSFGASPGMQFSTTVDLKEQPRGIYFVELKADNERIVRKLVVQ